MKRRAFIAAFGGAAVWPLPGVAQQSATPVIGVLTSSSPDAIPELMSAFRQGLAETGYMEGKNVAIEHRWAGSEYERFRSFAADLVDRHAAIIFAGGGGAAASATKATTTTIPIVFVTAGDPVELGLVASINRPGANITGISFLSSELEAKRLGLLHELVPNASTVAVVINPNFLDAAKHLKDVQQAGGALGLQLLVLQASTGRDIDVAFATLVQERAGALLVTADAFLFGQRQQLITLAAHHAIPAIYSYREFAKAGGLASLLYESC
jgi:putative ABC transport system substrate-binding protein